MDGEPLHLAEVEFQPDGGKPPSYSYTDKEGRYEMVYSREKNTPGTWPATITDTHRNKEQSKRQVLQKAERKLVRAWWHELTQLAIDKRQPKRDRV